MEIYKIHLLCKYYSKFDYEFFFYKFYSIAFSAFVNEFDFHDMPIDIALRKFQSSFRLPVSTRKVNYILVFFLLKGEAQKIEQLMKVNFNILNKGYLSLLNRIT